MAIKWKHIKQMDVDPSTGPGGNSGLRVHNMTNAQQPTATSSNNGLLAYDTTNNQLEAVINGSWTTIGAVGAGDNTLDNAYDQGGAGSGRSITADSGAVTITVSDTSNNAALSLIQNDSTNNPVALQFSNAGTGNDISADNWSMSSAGALTAASATLSGTLTSAGITDSGTSALTTLTATTGTITTLTGTTANFSDINSAASGNTNLTLDAAGTGTIGIGTNSTGAITLGQSTTLSTGASLTLTNGNLTLSAGGLDVTAGAGDGDALDLVNLAGSAALDLDVTAATTAAVIDIDASTGSGNIIDVAFSGAYTGDALVLNMTNAVGANAIVLTGAGTRTVPLVSVTDVPTTSAPTLDLNLTPGAAIQAGIDIDVAGTTAADIVTVDFSAAHTGSAFLATMANAIAGTAFEAVGSGLRTQPLVLLTDTGDNGGSTIDINSTATHATGAVIDIDEAGTVANDILSMDFSAAYAGDGINITMTNAAAGAQALVVDGGHAASGEIVSFSTSGALAGGTGKLLGLTSSGNLAAATNGACLTVSETGAAQATSYAISVASTNNEALLVDTGKSRFDEETTFKASNRNFVHPNFVAAGGAANAITATLTDSDGANVPLADGLTLLVDLGANTLQAGANTMNLNAGGAVSIVSHYNVANNIGTAYAAQGFVTLVYNQTSSVWMDMSQ